MFGSFLLVLKQFGCQRFVSGIIPSEWPRSSDGEALHVAPDLPSQHLRARPDDFPVAKLEVVHVGRRVDPPQRLVEPKERALERNLESLRQNYLEDISGFNVVFGLSDSFAEILLAYIRLRLAETNLIAAGRISQQFLRFFDPVFLSVEVVCFAADMVENDPVLEESEFYIGKPVAFVS